MTILEEVTSLIEEGKKMEYVASLPFSNFPQWRTKSLVFLGELSINRYCSEFQDGVKEGCTEDIRTGVGILSAAKTGIESGNVGIMTKFLKIKRKIFSSVNWRWFFTVVVVPVMIGVVFSMLGDIKKFFQSEKNIQPSLLWKEKEIPFITREDYEPIKNLSLNNSTVLFIEGIDYVRYTDKSKRFQKFKFKYEYVGESLEYKVSYIDKKGKDKKTNQKKNNEFLLSVKNRYNKGNEYLLEAKKPAHYIVISLESLVKKDYRTNSLNIKYFDYLSPTKEELMNVLDEGTDVRKPVFNDDDD